MFYYYKNFPEESIVTPEGAVGTAVHKIIELHYDGSDYKETRAGLIRDHDFDHLLVERLDNSLSNFIHWFPSAFEQERGRPPVFKEHDYKEYWFNEKLSDDVSLAGKIDYIFKDDGIVIDWKTGQTKKNISNDIQYIIYYTMYKKVFGHYPNAVYQVNLAKGELNTYYPNQTYIDTLYNSIIPKLVAHIKADTYYREGYFNGSCYRCNFIGICNRDL
jgi:RecB family exonuclease